MIERSFWPFYLFVIILSAFTIYFLSESKFKLIKILGVLLSIFFVFGLFTESNINFIPSSIKEELFYKKLINDQKNSDVIILINKLYYYYPITNYYLNSIFKDKVKNKQIKTYLIKSENIKQINNEIDKIIKIENFKKELSIVFFNYHITNKDFYKNLKIKYPYKNIKIYNFFSQEKNLLPIFK